MQQRLGMLAVLLCLSTAVLAKRETRLFQALRNNKQRASSEESTSTACSIWDVFANQGGKGSGQAHWKYLAGSMGTGTAGTDAVQFLVRAFRFTATNFASDSARVVEGFAIMDSYLSGDGSSELTEVFNEYTLAPIWASCGYTAGSKDTDYYSKVGPAGKQKPSAALSGKEKTFPLHCFDFAVQAVLAYMEDTLHGSIDSNGMSQLGCSSVSKLAFAPPPLQYCGCGTSGAQPSLTYGA